MANLQVAGVVGNGTPAGCTEAALTAALTGSGTVTFNCGGAVSIPVTSLMTITADTVIQGRGVFTINGGLTTGLFYVVAPASLTLSDITLDSAIPRRGMAGRSGPVAPYCFPTPRFKTI